MDQPPNGRPGIQECGPSPGQAYDHLHVWQVNMLCDPTRWKENAKLLSIGFLREFSMDIDIPKTDEVTTTEKPAV